MSVQIGSRTSSVLEHAAPMAGTNSYKSKAVKTTFNALEIEGTTSVSSGIGTVVACNRRKVTVQWNEDGYRRNTLFDVDHDDIDMS
jgi:hypothetical protein